MRKHGTIPFGSSAAFILALASSACSSDPRPGEGVSGISTQAMLADGTDVEAIRFDVTPVSCDDGSPAGATISETESVDADNVLPGSNTNLQNAPLDASSAHRFADSFMVLAPGCYDVSATPVNGAGADSEDCASAFQKRVVVKAGQTTEVFMINQCHGDDPGGLDAIAALNHEPTIEDVEFVDSKFACGSPTQICAAASDQDGDPLELVLSSEDCDVRAGEGGDGKQCWDVTCHSLGQHDLTVTVYDLLHGKDGNPQRIEDWLMEQGYPSESHAELDFWTYTDGFLAWADGDGDGYGAGPARVFCQGDDATGYVDNDTDCDDGNASIHPAAEEVQCDGVDQDCSGEDACESHCKEGFSCGTYAPGQCADCAPDGVCVKTAEGGALCHRGVSCSGLQACTQTADCTDVPGSVCVVETCCGAPLCIPPANLEPLMCAAARAAAIMSDPDEPMTVRF